MKFKMILLILIFYSTILYAEEKYKVSFGITYSYFEKAKNAEPDLGIQFRFQRSLINIKNFSLQLGIGFATRGATLKHRSIAPYSPAFPMEAYYWDINAMIGYWEFPISLEYKLKIKKDVYFKLSGGLNYIIPQSDYSDLDKKEFIEMFDLDLDDLNKYDFWFEQDNGFGDNRSRIIQEIGLEIIYKKYGLKLLFPFDNQKGYSIKNLSEISYKMRSLYFVLTYSF